MKNRFFKKRRKFYAGIYHMPIEIARVAILSVPQIWVFHLASNCMPEFKTLSHAEGMLKTKWDLRELWRGLERSPKNL